MTINAPIVVLGIISGLTYGMLAVGLVLIYRTSRIINFAHGEVGALAATVFGVIVYSYHVPYWVMFPGGLLVGAGASMLVEVVAVRRLRKAPAIMTILATLGFAAFFGVFEQVINTVIANGSSFPQPVGLPKLKIGAFYVTPAYTLELVGVPLIVTTLVLFLRYSRFGIAIRASADNRDNATMRGIAPSRMSLMAWGIAGVISAFTAITQFPSEGFNLLGQSLGPSLLVRALVCAVIARMDSFPVAMIGGVALGVVEQVLLANFNSGGQVEVIIFLVMLVALLLQSKQGGRSAEQGSWLAVGAAKPIPAELKKLWSIRHLNKLGVSVVVVVMLTVLRATNHTNYVMITAISFTLIGLSVYVVTGLGGQLSLGQVAIAGVGAVFSYHITHDGVNFGLAVLLAGGYSAVVSLLIGLPALRIRGLMLTVSSLAFAVMCDAWLFNQKWAFGGGVRPHTPSLPGVGLLDTGKRYYLVALPALLLGLLLTYNVSRGGVRRTLVAVRDNEDGARAFTVHATRVKLQAFAVSGFLAGVGGAIYGHSLPQLNGTFFNPQLGITVVAIAAIGGISLMAGSFLGALYLIAFPELVSLGSAGLAATDLGWLLLILYFPGGLAQLATPVRDAVVVSLARLHGLKITSLKLPDVVEDSLADAIPSALQVVTRDFQPPAAGHILEVRDLRKSFGGIQAVRGVSLTVTAGEIFGLIGPNGAGKTTLFEMLSGFTKPDAGSVIFDGQDVTSRSPENRAELGLVRSFQDARLFPTATVLDCVRLSFERTDPTRVMPALLGLPSALRRDRRADALAREAVGNLGLDRYKDKTISELSTGTRRITELACLISMKPKLLLLDEPSSGIAQRETEALGDLIRGIKSYLDATIVIIEHDMPLVAGLCDHVLAMETGVVIAFGDPASVISDPQVIESYLGGSVLANQRSGAHPLAARLPDPVADLCAAVTRSGSRCRRLATVGRLCLQHSTMPSAHRLNIFEGAS